MGLGDRHGENIMLDQTSGECVHVDFDCLFDKFQVPRLSVLQFEVLLVRVSSSSSVLLVRVRIDCSAYLSP